MKPQMIYSNDYVTLEWDGERLILLDTDGYFIDYFFYEKDLPENANLKEEIKMSKNSISSKTLEELVRFLQTYFFSVEKCKKISRNAIEKYVTGPKKDFINRVGNYLLYIKE